MRILKTLFSSLVFFLIAGSVIYFGGREVLLLIASAQIRSSVTTLRSVARNTGSYLLECREKLGVTRLEQPINSLQLRFLSDNEYQIEVVCQRFLNDPIVISQESLPPFVTKIPGYSGMVWDEEAESVIGLETFDRQQFLKLSHGQVTSHSTPPEVTTGPITSCGGYGYFCCNPDTTQGSGGQITTATDCPATCYQNCGDRPEILTLSTDPFYNVQTRTLTVAAGDPVMFNYIAKAGASATAKVEINYGDGHTENVVDLNGTFTHIYQCDQPQCQYQASVSVTNEQGIRSVMAPISQVTVVVTR